MSGPVDMVLTCDDMTSCGLSYGIRRQVIFRYGALLLVVDNLMTVSSLAAGFFISAIRGYFLGQSSRLAEDFTWL